MERFGFPDGLTILRKAEDCVQGLHDLYHEHSFTELAHDRQNYGPLKQDRKATPYIPGSQPYRDQNRWESVLWRFNQICPPDDPKAIAAVTARGINFAASEMRQQVNHILLHLSQNRPDTLDDARTLLDRFLHNFQVARKCAELFSRGSQISYQSAHMPKYFLAVAELQMEDKLFSISCQTKGKLPWPSRESFHTLLRRDYTSSIVLRMPNSYVPSNIMAYYIVHRERQDGLSGTEEIAAIMDAGAYAAEMPNNYLGPDLVEVMATDILRHNFRIDHGNKKNPYGYTQMSYEIRES